MINRRMPRGYPRQPLPYVGPWPTTPGKRRTRRRIAQFAVGVALALVIVMALALGSAAQAAEQPKAPGVKVAVASVDRTTAVALGLSVPAGARWS